jgi:hypothetical protein
LCATWADLTVGLYALSKSSDRHEERGDGDENEQKASGNPKQTEINIHVSSRMNVG